MPRYFFHFTDGKRQFTDDTGSELSGLVAAREQAIVQVRDLRSALSEPGIQAWNGWKMTVADANARIVFELGFDLEPVTSQVGDSFSFR